MKNNHWKRNVKQYGAGNEDVVIGKPYTVMIAGKPVEIVPRLPNSEDCTQEGFRHEDFDSPDKPAARYATCWERKLKIVVKTKPVVASRKK